MKARTPYPELVVAGASAAWGLFWIPLRYFQSQGLSPAWATLAQFLAPLVALIPVALYRVARGRPTGIQQAGTGLLIGTAVALYLESLLLTEVARALILFYAMPAWGTLLELGLMRRHLTRSRAIALVLSVLGMLSILGPGGGSGTSVSLGDLMALLSGIIFAFGAMRVRQAPETSTFEQLFAFFLYGFVAALVLALLPLGLQGNTAGFAQLTLIGPSLLVVAICYLIPVMGGIYWGSKYVDPGRLGILLQIEAVVGIASAALLSGEPFGPRQTAGALLVVVAGIVEVLGNRRRTTSHSPPSPTKG